MGVAQLVERWIVVPVAVGSNPTTHPTPTTLGDEQRAVVRCSLAESKPAAVSPSAQPFIASFIQIESRFANRLEDSNVCRL